MSKGSPRVTIRLEPDFYKWMNEHSQTTGKQKTEIIRAALQAYKLESQKDNVN